MTWNREALEQKNSLKRGILRAAHTHTTFQCGCSHHAHHHPTSFMFYNRSVNGFSQRAPQQKMGRNHQICGTGWKRLPCNINATMHAWYWQVRGPGFLELIGEIITQISAIKWDSCKIFETTEYCISSHTFFHKFLSENPLHQHGLWDAFISYN